MFDFVKRRKRVVQAIMVLAVMPFLFWGIESYQRDDGNVYIAIVDGEEIWRREFEQALRDHQNKMRSMLGERYDSAMFDDIAVRNSVLDMLIQQRLLRREAVNTGMTVLDSQLINVIGDIAQFQQNGKFSNQQYQVFLRSQGLNPPVFEAQIREELMLQQLLDAYSKNGFISDAVAKRVVYLSKLKREIEQIQILPGQFLSQINPGDDEIQDYYDSRQTDFRLPERVQVEYVVLSLDELAAQQDVSGDEIKQYYFDHQNEFGQPEERQASHILFSLAGGASEEDKAVVLSVANDVLDQVKQNPEQFSELALQYSDDPGSAAQGGDLGFFGRGMMVKSFEDEIFQMQPDEISELVETDFGFHIIKLVAINDAKVADIDTVTSQIEQSLKRMKAGNKFGEMAEDFSNTVYEQSDTLDIAAQEFGLSIQKSDWINRKSREPAILTHDRLLDAIFSDDVLIDKRNTSAIEVKEDTLVSVRIIDHRTASLRSLEMVRGEVIEILKAKQSVEMAAAQGETKLAQLLAGDETAAHNWKENKQISYMQSQGIDSVITQAVFRSDLTKLPAYIGAVNARGGYTLVRINRVIEPDVAAIDDSTAKNLENKLQQMLAREEMAAYLTGLRQRYDVSIKQQVLLPNE